jgi:hypothetical protein
MPTHAELAKVHIAKRDLKLNDELYRGFMNVLFGETSAKDLTHEQIEELLEHFKSLGWGEQYTGSKGLAGHKKSGSKLHSSSHGSGPATMAQISLIVYLWKHGPGIRHKSMQALDHFLNHHFHISSLKQIRARRVPGILGAIKNMGKM